MFDLKTFKPLGRIPAAEDADAIIYDAASNRVFTLQRRRALVDGDRSGGREAASRTSISAASPSTACRPATERCTRTSPTTARSSRSTPRRCKVTRRWSTAPCKNPVAMAIDVAHQRLFSGCRSGVMAVSDYRAGKVVATLPIGAGVDGAGVRSGDGRRVRVECATARSR